MKKSMVLLAFIGACTLSQFYRSMLGVIGPEVVSDLRLNPFQLGLLSYGFFFTCALLQIPLGVALDRFEPRKVLGSSLVLATAGVWLFGRGRSLPLALTGEILLGAGLAPAYMAMSTHVASQYKAERFVGTLTAISGTALLGGLLSSYPLGLSTHLFGWRTTILASSVLLVLVTAGLFGSAERRSWQADDDVAWKELFFNPGLYRLLPLAFATSGVSGAVRVVWAGSYLAEIYHVGTASRGLMLALISLSLVAITYALPMAVRTQGESRVMIMATALGAIALALLAIPVRLPIQIVLVLFAAALWTSAPYALLMSAARASVPAKAAGRAMTILNCAVFLGIAVIEQAVGYLLYILEPLFGMHAAYSIAFGTCAALLAVAAVVAIPLQAERGVYRTDSTY